ncbi:glucosamine-6-phosphate deaminase [Aquiflexum sp.]|uniref:glucosamine-6-phosphate deaminase n=1 Tax=Aquiflexum sp. TaxID=1872584 RepID=UPI0035938AF8
MKIIQAKDPKELGKSAGKEAGNIISQAIDQNGYANIVLATGTSQFETINQLVKEDVPWEKVTVFHLDEYIGISNTHPASFRKYLQERFVDQVNKLGSIHFIDGEHNPEEACRQLGEVISRHSVDLALVGIGENGHLAFNDPPADFDTGLPYLVVDLDQSCRMQQLNEGWFDSLEDVPSQAISMSIKQIMKSKHIICSVPEKRKAKAVKDCLENKVTNLYPASILQNHPSCTIFLDKASASLLSIAN